MRNMHEMRPLATGHRCFEQKFYPDICNVLYCKYVDLSISRLYTAFHEFSCSEFNFNELLRKDLHHS